jgi:inward rectifier potassium channel
VLEFGKSSARQARDRKVPHFVSSQIVRIGASSSWRWQDFYHICLLMPWPWFLLSVTIAYLISNALFAGLYLLGGDCINNAQPGSFADAFFFSVQTMATIGYGGMTPKTPYANILVTFEALVGLIGVTMGTGIMFARLSKPTARVIFSQYAVVTPQEGLPTLTFRVANQRHNQILEAQVKVTLVRNERSPEGQFMRRFYDLKLVRSQTRVFMLSWSVMHVIDELSPLFEMNEAELFNSEAEVLVTVTGIDETVSQTIHARHSYFPGDVLWNKRLADILLHTPDGELAIDFAKFHHVVDLESPL